MPRSLFDRFRSKRAQLSVTDLVAGVWCEQQFQYTLERGFRRRTPAMTAGTRIHKVLEEEVHTTVPVEITTREDAFGLKLFNMCQGLLSLEEQGMTRELDVFGYLDGVLVQGVIDEITYVDPSHSAAAEERRSPPKAAFITDTKTRSSNRTPTGSQLRSTALQLMFYHRLLTRLPAVPFAAILTHHALDGAARLSDRFIAQIASVTSGISLDALLANNNLHGLWSIVLRQLEKAVPAVGATVGVVFRAQSSGAVMARRSWGVDAALLESHLSATMEWWRGERGSVGVEIEDAWKCRSCDFAETCVWRLGQIERLAEEMRTEKKKVKKVVGAKPRSRSRSKSKKSKTATTTTEEGGESSATQEGGGEPGSDSAGSAKPPRRRRKAKVDITSGESDTSGGDSEKRKVRAKKKAKKED